MKKGTRIVYTATLGGMEHEDATKYIGTVEAGAEGVYLGKHRGKLGREGWSMTKSLTEPPMFVPVHASHFRLAAPQADSEPR